VLLSAKGWEDRDALDSEWRQFKYMAIAAHPENTRTILDALDDAQEKASYQAAEEGWSEWAEEINDEELADYVPFSSQSQELIDALRRDGFLALDD
jgi:hypothetical protein